MKHCSHSVLNFLDHCWAFTVFDRNRLAKLLRQVGIQICQWILCGLSRPQVFKLQLANLTGMCCWDIGTLQIKVVTICTFFVDHSVCCLHFVNKVRNSRCNGAEYSNMVFPYCGVWCDCVTMNRGPCQGWMISYSDQIASLLNILTVQKKILESRNWPNLQHLLLHITVLVSMQAAARN